MTSEADKAAPSSRTTCSAERAGHALTVLPTTIRKSKSGRRRAAVLIGVHLLIAVHVAHWLRTGATMTPLEPSEAMEFSKHSIVNAGLIFFALTILSTVILGRWFCGWGCHLVALQDLSRWILGKLKIKPKPARLGLLGAVPLIAFLYMFIGPLVYRALHGHPIPEVTAQYTTEAFWATFPPVIPAILTFVTCGFIAIYLLGAKGFCTYGCPYGAIFGVADQVAPLRIRVTDACRGCGHCTAVCSSNVRVHQEVRDYGMVVDPGCMKTFDCVSVCPSDALYFGAGRPAVMAPRRAGVPASTGQWRARLASAASTAAFMFAAFSLFTWYDGDFEWRMALILTAMAFGLAVFFKGKSTRLAGYTLREELALATIFLVSMTVFRGLYGGVPFLFALGLSGVAAYLGLELARLAYRPNRALHGWQLKRSGQLAPAGVMFVLLMAGFVAFSVHSGVMQYRHQIKPRVASGYYREGVQLALANQLQDAIRNFERALSWRPDFVEARENLGGMLCATGQFEQGIEQYLIALQHNPDDAGTHVFLARAYLASQQTNTAAQHLQQALTLDPTLTDARRLLEELRSGDAASASPIQDQVVASILEQPLGTKSTLKALDLPAGFLRRVADRVIRDAYRRQNHDRMAPEDAAVADREAVDPAPRNDHPLVVQHPHHDAEIIAYRRALPAVRPALPGFRAPILNDAHRQWHATGPVQTSSPAVRRAAEAVADQLASTGLLRTTVTALRILGPEQFCNVPLDEERLSVLRRVGLPIDLLRFFHAGGAGAQDGPGIVPLLARHLADGATDEQLPVSLENSVFAFSQSLPGLRLTSESGEQPVSMLRLQIPTREWWQDETPGDVLDMARQLIARLPDAKVIASVHDADLQFLRRRIAGWSPAQAARLLVLAEPFPIAQWAQDNGKSSEVPDPASGTLVAATLAPRYASQREDGSVLAPNDSFVMDSLHASGHPVVQSPLLFQGGNLMAVTDPATNRRVLLIGEAEVYRNTALGLSTDQVLEAFRIECGVDECVVLPAVSFHIDFDVCVRAHGGRLVAFVNDPIRTSRLIVGLGIDALQASAVLHSSTAASLEGHLRAGRMPELCTVLHRWISTRADDVTWIRAFAGEAGDSPSSNLQRFLISLDILTAVSFEPRRLSSDPVAVAYLESLRRREADRAEFSRRLQALGWDVVPVPGLSEAQRSISYVNGLQEPDRYFMPAYGGFFGPLDRVAQAAFGERLPGVQIIPIMCGASQRRAGAVHCSMSAYRRPSD